MRVDTRASRHLRAPQGKLLHGEGMYRQTRNGPMGHPHYCMLLQKPIPAYALNPVPLFKMYRPNTGLCDNNTVLSDFLRGSDGRRYRPVDVDEAFKGWSAIYKAAERHCSHGPNCKRGPACEVGRLVQKQNLLVGAVIPYWKEIQAAVGYRRPLPPSATSAIATR